MSCNKFIEISTLENLYKMLSENPRFNIFWGELQIYNNYSQLISATKGSTNYNVDMSDNFIYFNNKKYFFAPTDLIEIELSINLMLVKINNKPFDNPEKNDLKQALNKILLDIANNNYPLGPKQKLFIDVFNYLNKKTTRIEFHYFLRKTLGNCFLKAKRKKNIQIQIPRAALVNDLGRSILTFLQHFYPKLALILNVLDFETSRENSIKPEFLSFIMDLHTYANKKNDEKQLRNLFISIDITDSTIQTLFSSYILNLFYTQYKKYTTTFMLLFPNFIYEDHKFYFWRKHYIRLQTQLGNFLLEILLNHNICIAAKLIKVKKEINMVIMNPKYFDSLLDMYKFKKPALVNLSNNLFKDIKDTFGETTEFSFAWSIHKKEKLQYIHNNLNINLEMQNNNTRKNIRPNFKYTINKESFAHFLKILQEFQIPMILTTDDVESYATVVTKLLNTKHFKYLLCFYDINLNFLEMLLKKYSNEYLVMHTLYSLIFYAFDFKIQPSYTILDIKNTIIKKATKDYKAILIDLSNKIEQYKIYFLGLIKDCILFTPWNYFIAESFVDSRGRLYNKEVFVNIQNYPLAKAFVKLYLPPNQNLNIRAWSIINQEINHTQCDNNDLAILKAPFTKIIDNNKISTLKYLYKYFEKNKVTFDKFKNFIERLNKENLIKDDLLTFIHSNAKKCKKTWIIFAKVIQYTNKEPNVIELDASNSGVQMISILFNNIQLAQECNLIGNDDNDAYTRILTKFNDTLLSLKQLTTIVVNDINIFKHIIKNKGLNNLSALKSYYSSDIKNIQSKNGSTLNICLELLTCFFTMDFNKSTWIYQLITYLEDYFNTLNIKIPLDIKTYLCLIPPAEHKILLNCVKNAKKTTKDFTNVISILRIAFQMEVYYDTYPELNLGADIWKDRDLFKKAVMTLYYNAKQTTRVQEFDLILKKHLKISKSNDITKGPKNMAYIINLLELFFKDYAKQHMKGIILMKLLTDYLVNKKEKIHICNKYFNIYIHPVKQKAIQIESSTYAGKRLQVSINIPTTEIDSRKLAQMLSPNIIHSMDAFIVHSFIEKMNNINDLFKKDGLNYTIGYYINHDSFACTLPILTPIILKQCYLDLVKQNYLSQILNLNKEYISSLQQTSTKDFLTLLNKNFNNNFMK